MTFREMFENLSDPLIKYLLDFGKLRDGLGLLKISIQRKKFSQRRNSKLF